MKKSIFTVLSAAVSIVATATYASAQPVSPPQCANQQVTDTLVCVEGGLTFTFDLVKFTGGGPAAQLDLSTPPTSAATAGLVVLGFTVLATTPVDIDLVYQVSSPNANITNIDSTFGPPAPAGSQIFESACPTNPTIVPPGCGTPYATVTNTTGLYTISSSFGPVNSIYIDKDIENFGFSEFTDSVEDPSVPEPMAMSLVGGGLALLGLLRFRTKK
jgi:hypothetical protein